MANRKPWNEKTSIIENIVAGLVVAMVLLCIEGLRFFVSYFIKPLTLNDVEAFGIPWIVAVAITGFLFKVFSNTLDAKQKHN